jgi:transposase
MGACDSTISVETGRDVVMPAPISMDLRLRIVRAVERGSSIREAARRFAVSPWAAIKLMQRVRATGSPAPARVGGHRRPLLAPHEAELRRLVAVTPDITLVELQAELERRLGLAAAGLSTTQDAPPDRTAAQKKALRAAEQDRPDVAAKRRRWLRKRERALELLGIRSDREAIGAPLLRLGDPNEGGTCRSISWLRR